MTFKPYYRPPTSGSQANIIDFVADQPVFHPFENSFVIDPPRGFYKLAC